MREDLRDSRSIKFHNLFQDPRSKSLKKKNLKNTDKKTNNYKKKIIIMIKMIKANVQEVKVRNVLKFFYC